jgi:hypothetical protein
MNFSVGKNDKPDELQSGGFNESRNHIIQKAPDLPHWKANRAAITIKDAHRYNPRTPKSSISISLSWANTCQYL